MTQDLRRGPKRFKKSWILLCMLIAGAVLFYKPLLLVGCRAALHRAIPPKEGRSLSYDQLQWEGDALALTGFLLKDSSSDLTIDRVELRFKGSVFGLLLAPEVTVVHPQIIVASTGVDGAAPIPFLYRSRFFQPRWTITNGVLQLPAASRFYFSMVPQESQGSIGRIAFSYDPSLSAVPMFTADLSVCDQNLVVGFQLIESDLSRLLPLTKLIASDVQRNWSEASGDVKLEGTVTIDSDHLIKHIQVTAAAKKIVLAGPKMGIDLKCEEMSAAFTYPSSDVKEFFLDKINAAILLKGGACSLQAPLVKNPVSFKDLDATLSFDSEGQPHFDLSGSASQQLEHISFYLSGSGGVQEDSTLFSELELSCQSTEGKKMQGSLSLCGQIGTELALRVQVDDADCKHLEFFRALMGAPGQCVDGSAACDVTFYSEGGAWTRAALEKCDLQHIRWYFPEHKMTAYAEEVMLDGAFAIDSQQKLSPQDLHLQVEGGEYVDPKFSFTSLFGKIEISQGVLQPSVCKGEWGALSTELAFLGPEGDHFADIVVDGDAKELLKLIGSEGSLPLHLQIAAYSVSGVIGLQGKGNLGSDAFSASASLSTASRTWNDLFQGNVPNIHLKEGKFSAEHLSEKSYGLFVPLIAEEVAVTGTLQCEALFSSERIQVKLTGDELHLFHPLAQIYVPQLKERPAQFFYDVPSKKWRGEIPLADALLKYPKLDLSFNNMEGSLKLEDDHVRAPSLYAECEGMALRGSVDLGLTEESQLTLVTSQVAGDVVGLMALLGKFHPVPHFETPIHGGFSSGDKGFVLNAQRGAPEWSFKGNFDGLELPLNEATSLKEGRCELAFDSKTQQLELSKAEAIWELKDKTALTVQLKKFSASLIENTLVDVAIKVVDGKKEFAHFGAKATLLPTAQWDLVFDTQATHFGGVLLNISQCTFNDKFQLSSFDMKPTLKCQDLHAQATFLQNAGFLPPTFSPQSLKEWQLEGTLQAQMFTEDMSKRLILHVESSDLKVKGEPLTSFELRAHRVEDKWLIERLSAGSLKLKGAFIVDADRITVPSFEGSWEEVLLKGSGFVTPDKKRFSCIIESLKGDLSQLKMLEKVPSLKGTMLAGIALNGDFSNLQDPLQIVGEANLLIDLQSPMSLTASNKHPLKFTYTSSQGLICSGIDLQCKHKSSGAPIAHLGAETLTFADGEHLHFNNIEFSLTRALLGHAVEAKILPSTIKELEWEGKLEGTGTFEFSKTGPIFQANLKPGRYGYSGRSLPVEQMQLRFEKEILTLKVKTQLEGQPLWGSLQVDVSNEPYGMLKLLDNPKEEGLKILFKTHSEKITLDSIQGSCYGLKCSLAKSTKRKDPLATVLTGDLKMDIGAISALFPKEMRDGIQTMKFGPGYQWQGDLVLFHEAKRGFAATGTLTGKDFELFGYSFRNLEASLEVNPERLVLSHLKIDDPAGAISIKKIEMVKEENWNLRIPQILVQQLQPSLMRKVGIEQTSLKPFTIKNFTLTDVFCKLGDKSTLEGSGHLLFVNQFKKESSMLDVPFEMLKKFGLDLGIMTPVQGELQLELRGDKFYLVSLDNSFSEGDRSEFYLPAAKELSYIDLEGKVHINLKMRQDVVLKLTEPFTLTIRGTLDKPRYGLQL